MPIKREVNKKFFSTWSPEMAYVLGFFAADGSMSVHNNGGQYLEFHISEGDLLYKIQKVMKSNHKIALRKKRGSPSTMYRIQIGSKDMCNDLRKLGFSERKTEHMPFPKVPSKYLSSFVRGYFEGDGNVWIGLIHKNRRNPMQSILTAFTSCSLGFLQKLRLVLEKEGQCKGGCIRKVSKRNAYRLQYSIHDSILLYHFMYDNLRTDLFLDRKKKVFERFLDLRP